VFEGFDPITVDFFWSVVIVVTAVLLRWVVARAVQRRITDSEQVFRTRKTITYLVTLLTLVLLARQWIDETTDLATFLGLIGAGLVVALGEVVRNLAGWAYIMLRSPFRVGDRVEIKGTAGDVIDIRVLRFSLMEIRDWVEADQSTGRIVHIPNGLLFSNALANFTQGFHHIWHEVPVLVTFESDWRRAEELVQHALDYHAIDSTEMEASEELERASKHFFIRYGALTPTVYLSVREDGVLLTGRVLVKARDRRTIDSKIWKHVLSSFAAEPSVELAYRTVRMVHRLPGETGDAGTHDDAAPLRTFVDPEA